MVGFDDIEIVAHREIQLTTMAQQKAEMGRLAVLGIMEILRDPMRFGGQPLQVLAPALIVRRTCGALAGSRGRQGGSRG